MFSLILQTTSQKGDNKKKKTKTNKTKTKNKNKQLEQDICNTSIEKEKAAHSNTK